MDIEFKDALELYNKVLPALKFKKRMILKKGTRVTESKIFEYLIKTKWSKEIDLALNDIVSDIISVDEDVFI